jgi:hypothetical protein
MVGGPEETRNEDLQRWRVPAEIYPTNRRVGAKRVIGRISDCYVFMNTTAIEETDHSEPDVGLKTVTPTICRIQSRFPEACSKTFLKTRFGH